MLLVFSTHGYFEPMPFGSLVISASEHLGQAKGNFYPDSNLPRTDSTRQIGQIGQHVTW